VGFWDRFRGKIAAPAHQVGVAPAQQLQVRPAPAPVAQSPAWVPPGTTVQIGRFSVSGGMLYVGAVPRHLHGTEQMPECVDPSLKINYLRPDHVGAEMPYWPAYHSITPAGRSGYLAWLAGGRVVPDAYIGYVFLYFYGLERRVLVDARADPAAREDLRRIYAEVLRLLRIYGSNRSFRSCASEFQDCLELMLTGEGANSSLTPPDPGTTTRYAAPVSLRMGLGLFARQGRPIPAEWAHSWALLHPEIFPRTPAARCPEEFRRLFLARYRRVHGDGLVVRPGKRQVSVSYRPASAGISSTHVELGIPDVLTEIVPTRQLAELVEDCANALEAYSRLVGRRPGAAGTLAAAALLPDELLDGCAAALEPVREVVDRALSSSGVVDGEELIALWPARVPGKFGKPDAVGLAQLLERIGVGVEPDVRMGGRVLGPGPAVVFRAEHDQPTTASHEYAAATILLHLAAVVSAADGEVSEMERTHLLSHLESALHLSPGEKERLAAHLTWLLAGETKLTGLKKRLAALTAAQRDHVADFLTMVAAIDGQISPGEVKTLRKIYTLLELDPELVYGKLHASASSRPAPATEPVAIGGGGIAPPDFAIPRPAAMSAQTGTLVLDQQVIEARLAESAAVSALLADIFADDVAEEPLPTLIRSDVPSVAGLDAAHSAFVRKLAESPLWTRSELEELCAELGIMIDGALDSVNEAALDVADEPLVEDDGDEYRINDYARGELLA